MNKDDLERQLRTQAGPREQGYQPTPLPATPASPPRRSRLATTSRVALVGATVVAGAALAIVLTNMPQTSPGGVGSGGSAESSPSAQPTAEPSPPAAACTAEDFAWSTDPWGAAAGSRGTSVLLRGVASLDACRLDGDVSVEIRDANGLPLVSATTVSHVHAAAGEVFEIGIAWSNWCAPDPTQPLSAVLQLPGDGSDVPLIQASGEVLIPPCNGEAQPTNLSVTDVQPSDRAFPDG
jgi:hypothetical protein